ncbi:hypothetical protein [Frankia sp. R82]|uniref:hypothetical protein n=1 Tax=Frankia sp. R82 TaxID=2950553 RepID=UPI002042C0F8|nr:hypothetical protein [Frankia sp. R82]MCM3884142.1 hypothetical protein [Frankia sp. R82]
MTAPRRLPPGEAVVLAAALLALLLVALAVGAAQAGPARQLACGQTHPSRCTTRTPIHDQGGDVR